MNQPIPDPIMDAETQRRFIKNVFALFRAGWTDAKIAEWAGSAASGYGRYFTARTARPVIREMCLGVNRETRAKNNALVREMKIAMRAQFPGFKEYFK